MIYKSVATPSLFRSFRKIPNEDTRTNPHPADIISHYRREGYTSFPSHAKGTPAVPAQPLPAACGCEVCLGSGKKNCPVTVTVKTDKNPKNSMHLPTQLLSINPGVGIPPAWRLLLVPMSPDPHSVTGQVLRKALLTVGCQHASSEVQQSLMGCARTG